MLRSGPRGSHGRAFSSRLRFPSGLCVVRYGVAVGDSRSVTHLERCLDRAEAVWVQDTTAVAKEVMREELGLS